MGGVAIDFEPHKPLISSGFLEYLVMLQSPILCFLSNFKAFLSGELKLKVLA